MKKILFAVVVILCSLLKSAKSQNLVPNSSFENFSQCPHIGNKIYYATGWFQPNKYPGGFSVNQSSSTDYYNSCDTGVYVSVPNNGMGFQPAKTGNAYIGIVTYSYFFNGNAGREYAEIKLSQELIANKKYTLKYFASMANESRYSITKFDAYLSNDSLLYSSTYLLNINVIPQFQYNSRVDDTLTWVEITGNYTAVGGERFLTIGNFHDGAFCDTVRTLITPQMNCCYAYYYIDDVSLEEDTITGINVISKAEFSIYPNPAKNSIHISTSKPIKELSLLDFNNRILLRQKVNMLNPIVDMSQVEDGIYM